MENLLLQLESYNQNLTLEEREELRSKLLGFTRRLQKSIQIEKGNLKWGIPYSKEEKDFIKEKDGEGWTNQQIADALQRTVNGVIQQRQKLMVKKNRVKSMVLASAWCPNRPDPNFLIPQHVNRYSQPA